MSGVAIVGGGVAGCAAARALAPDHDVVVVEADQIASGATGRAAGLVAPTVFYDDRPDLAAYLLDAFRELDGTGQFQFTERARLELTTPEDATAAETTADRLASDGFDVRFLTAAAVETEYPAFDVEQFAGAVEHRAGWVDPHTLATTLADEAERLGATVRQGVEVTDVVAEDGAVSGVDTADGRLEAETVVVAGGYRTRDLLGEVVDLPLRPYRTQCVVLSPDEPLGDRFPLGRATSEEVYFRPEHNGDLLVGGASAPIEDPERASQSADESFREHVAAVVPKFLPALRDAAFVDGWAGVDCATPDGRGIVDTPTEGPSGLVVATGFTGLGVMTAPAVGSAVRALVADEDAPFDPDAFALDRFEDRSPGFAFESTFDH